MTKRPYRRRKPVSCVFCDEETYDPDKVCVTCRRVYAMGEAFYNLREKGEEPEILPVNVHMYWRVYAWQAKAEDASQADRNLVQEFQEIVLKLANAQKMSGRRFDYYRSAVEFVVGQAYKEDGQLVDTYGSSDNYTFLMTREAAGQLQRLVEIVRALRQISKNEAKEKAERFVFAMAKGEVDLDKVSSAYPMKEE